MLLACLFSTESFAQNISSKLFGQNAWMPDTIGTRVYNGQLHKKWNDIKSSGAALVRFGGIGPDQNKPSYYQYIKMIDSIRVKGMEPMMQVPYNKNIYTAAQAADIVKFINITKGRNVKYWVIGNEPDLSYGYTTAAQVAAYIKAFAYAMKQVDPSILIVGPEVAWYNTNIINGLTSPGGPDDITGKDAAGRYYLDIISFHTYPFNGTQTRSDVITKLTAPGAYQDDLTALNSRVATCNTYHSRTGDAILKVAVTETNVNWQNPLTDNLNSVGANSFIGGQFWAEVVGISMKKGVEFVNFWSVIEGNSVTNNIGFLNTNNTKKPSFYHYKMLSDNFSGAYCDGSDNQAEVKTFGCKNDSQVVVMILNQSLTSDFAYTVNLNKDNAVATGSLKINIDANLNKEYSSIIQNQSSTLLVFDKSGNILKKIEYKLNGNADLNLAPTVTNLVSQLVATISPAVKTNICSGSSITLNADQAGTYQWKKEGTDIMGATSKSYTAAIAGDYSVTISNGPDTVTSSATPITVNSPVAVITASGPTTLYEGENVVLNSATGVDYIYQWKKDGFAISGANTASYSAGISGDYQVKVTLGTCNSWSAPVNIVVLPLSLVATITPSESTTIRKNGSVNLMANTGIGFIYEWRRNGDVIAGATASDYLATHAGDYQVKITSGASIAYSALVTVTVVKGRMARVSDKALDSTNLELVNKEAFGAIVWPNPSNDAFQLIVNSLSENDILVNVYDLAGHLFLTLKGSDSSNLKFGSELAPGYYIAEVIQDRNKSVFKIIKTN